LGQIRPCLIRGSDIKTASEKQAERTSKSAEIAWLCASVCPLSVVSGPAWDAEAAAAVELLVAAVWLGV